MPPLAREFGIPDRSSSYLGLRRKPLPVLIDIAVDSNEIPAVPKLLAGTDLSLIGALESLYFHRRGGRDAK